MERDIRAEQGRDAIGWAISYWDKYFARLQATRETFNRAMIESQNPNRGENENNG